MIELLRAIKYKYLYLIASKCASSSKKSSYMLPQIAFIIGCGRSGTTLLGEILGSCSEVSYLFEPYHIWSAIDPKLDVLNLFKNTEPLLFVDGDFFSNSHQSSFLNCVKQFNSNKQSKLLIEKTPLNVFRIGWIDKVAPNAKFIHIVRDGVDVCTSIERLANTNSYRIAGKPNLNQWWGNDYSKWKALSKDGTSANYFPKEVDRLDNHFSKAAYEWLLSLKEMDRQRSLLGNRLHEITYQELVTSPHHTLEGILHFLDITPDHNWLEQSVAKIRSPKQPVNREITLPKKMCETFNHYQERYGFLHQIQCEAS